MKKICFVTTVSLTIRAFVLPAIQYLAKNTDWELTVICDEDPELLSLFPEGVRYVPISMKRGISFAGIGAMLKMARLFRTEKFDLVQYSTPNASLYASMAAKLAGVPVRLYCQWGIAYVGFQGMKRKVFKGIEKLVCKFSTRIEPDSFGNLNFCHKEKLYGPEKSSVIWNGSASGVDLNKFDITKKEQWRREIRSRLGIEEDTFVYGFVGRITRDKGINELLGSYRQILETERNTCLILVGSPEHEELLEQALYRWAQNEPQVIFCGYTNSVEQYIAAMDVYLLPSYREGFGSAVVEAEAMGVPVIVSDIPGPTDAIVDGQTGLIAKKADTETLYQAMLHIKNNEALRSELEIAAAKFAADHFEQTRLMGYILEDRKQLMNMR